MGVRLLLHMLIFRRRSRLVAWLKLFLSLILLYFVWIHLPFEMRHVSDSPTADTQQTSTAIASRPLRDLPVLAAEEATTRVPRPTVAPGHRSSPPERPDPVTRVWARDRHPCRKHFIDICGKTSQMTFNKDLLVPKWPKPQKISGLREAIAEHNNRQKKACEGKLADPRLLVYSCSKGGGGIGSKCRAFGDGYRGVTLAYILAVIEKRSFFLYTPTWLPFEKFFPPRMNYRLENCSALATPKAMQAIARHHMTFRMSGAYTDVTAKCPALESSHLRGRPDRILGLNSNQIFECYYRLLRESGRPAERLKHESVMRLVWETMFDFPGKDLEEMLQKFLRSEQIDLDQSVCIHVRSGSFADNDRRVACLYKNIDDIWRCARALEIASHKLASLQRTTWVIIGDNDLHKQMALEYVENCSKSDPLFVQSSVQRRFVDTSDFGRLGHTGGSNTMEQYRRVFFDLLLMSRCRHLVAMRSGFSGMAVNLHYDWSERYFVRVNKLSSPTNDVNKICVPKLGDDYG